MIKKIGFYILLIAILVSCSEATTSQKTIQQKAEKQLNFIVDNNKEWLNDKPVVFFLHGWKSYPQDLMVLKNRLGNEYNYVAIEAPIKINNKSFSWFDLEIDRGGVKNFNLDEFENSLSHLHTFLESFKKDRNIKSEDVLLFGFSQGATMALELAIRHPESVSAVIALSGLFVSNIANSDVLSNICDVDIFQAHGIYDKVVLIKDAEKVNNLLGNCDSYSFKIYKMAHEINNKLIVDIKLWMQQRN